MSEDTWPCPFEKKDCTHRSGYPKLDIGETRMQVCLNCRLTEIIQNQRLNIALTLESNKEISEHYEKFALLMEEYRDRYS